MSDEFVAYLAGERSLCPSISSLPPSPSQVRAAAWLHMRLGGVEFLPVDRSRLMGLLVNWSAFPHIMVGPGV